jgi:peptidoglycan/LPS O-acetylase OafA/YrhL
MPTLGKNKRFLEVDALRGIAVLLVVWMHCTAPFSKLAGVAAHGTSLFDIAIRFDTGRIGVIIFFAISGFVIFSSMKGEKLSGIKVFWTRRFFRLFPIYWLSIIPGIAIFWWIAGKHLDISTLIANITMFPLLFEKPEIISLYWTLEVELAFYILSSIIFLNGKIKSPVTIFLTSIILLIVFSMLYLNKSSLPNLGLWKTMPYYLSIMCWGALYRYYCDNRNSIVNIGALSLKIKNVFYAQTIAIISPALAAFVIYLMTGDEKFFGESVPIIIGMLLFLIGVNASVLRNRFLVWVGTISYSLYLFHVIVSRGMLLVLNYLPSSWSEQHLSVYLFVSTVLSLLMAAVLYKVIEKPCIGCAKKLTRNIVN